MILGERLGGCKAKFNALKSKKIVDFINTGIDYRIA